MNNQKEVEILLVEDNPTDAELALRASKKNNLANRVLVVTDGEKALDFIFARGPFSGRKIDAFVKSALGRHSRSMKPVPVKTGSGSPEDLRKTRFPPSQRMTKPQSLPSGTGNETHRDSKDRRQSRRFRKVMPRRHHREARAEQT